MKKAFRSWLTNQEISDGYSDRSRKQTMIIASALNTLRCLLPAPMFRKIRFRSFQKLRKVMIHLSKKRPEMKKTIERDADGVDQSVQELHHPIDRR